MAINRPVSQTRIATATWGIPITDAVNALAPTIPGPWLPLTLQNGWVQQGGWVRPSYCRIGDMVYCVGLITGGVAGAGATLPPGYRPTSGIAFSAARIGADSVLVTVNQNGIIDVPVAGGFISLANIIFSTIAPT